MSAIFFFFLFDFQFFTHATNNVFFSFISVAELGQRLLNGGQGLGPVGHSLRPQLQGRLLTLKEDLTLEEEEEEEEERERGVRHQEQVTTRSE